MSNYREKTAKVTGAAGALIAASDDFIRGNLFEGLVEGVGFGILGYIAGYVLGGIADYISGGDENNAKKAQSNDAIYKKLTA